MKKDEILDALEDEREQLLDVIEGLTDEELLQPGVVGDWSVKDIIAHLNSWEAELVRLLYQIKQGQKPNGIFFAPGDVDSKNAAFTASGRGRLLEQVMEDYEAVRRQTERRLESFSDKELNDAQRWPWLKGRPLWEWVAENSFAHEAEHRAQILAWRQNEQGT